MRKTILAISLMFLSTGLCAESFGCFDKTFFSGEFLWWKAQSDRFSATFFLDDTNVLERGAETREERHYNFGFAPGFRLGLETEISLCGSTFAPYINFTHFRSTRNLVVDFTRPANTTYTVLPVSNLMALSSPTIISDASAGTALNYSGAADFLYNRADLGISKVLFECERISIIPKIAFTYLHIRQSILEVIEIVSTTPANNTLNNGSSQSHFTGYGATLGFDTYYDVACGFSFYSNLGISGVWGPFTTSLNYTGYTTVPAPEVLNAEDSEASSFWVGRWIADLQAGIQYQTNVCNMFDVAARIGWEFVYLPDQFNFNDGANLTPFTISGLVAGVGIGF